MTSIEHTFAEMLLISDFPVGDDHFTLIHKLAGSPIVQEDMKISDSGRGCRWPLRLDDSYGKDASMFLWEIATYLTRNQKVVAAIHALGCNLQLNLYSVKLRPQLSICASTLSQLADLEIQLELFE